MNLTLTQPKRHSSSGSTKKEKEDSNPITLQQGLFIASKLMSVTSVGENFGSDFTRSFQWMKQIKILILYQFYQKLPK